MSGPSREKHAPPSLGARGQAHPVGSPLTGESLLGASRPLRRRQPQYTYRGDRRLALVIPAAALILALSIFPIIQLANMSLHDVTLATLTHDWDFVGLRKYQELFAHPDFWKILGNTLAFVVVVTALGLVGGFAAAVAVSPQKRGASFLLGLMVFLWAMPPVVVASIWKFLLSGDGLVNTILLNIGFSERVGFLFDKDLALWSVALVNAWAVIPFNALIFRAAILGIDPNLIEAAEMDGAGAWQRIRYVFIASVRPSTMVLTVLTVVYAFRSFDYIYIMTAGGPGTASTTLPYFAYVEALVNRDIAGGAATAILALLIVVIFAYVYVRDLRRGEPED